MRCLTLGVVIIVLGLAETVSSELEKNSTSSTTPRELNVETARGVRRKRKKLTTSCRLFEGDGYCVEDIERCNENDSEWYCEDEYGHFYKIDGLEPSLLVNITSGRSILTSHASLRRRNVKNEDDRLIIMSSSSRNTRIDVMDNSNFDLPSSRRRLAPSTGINSLLIVRVVAPDGSPGRTASEMSDEWFGTNGDKVNLASQYKACSGGKLQYIPATGQGIANGVVEVTLAQPLYRVKSSTAANLATDAAQAVIGGPLRRFTQHVIILPKLVDFGGFAAVAFIGASRAVFKDMHASNLMPQMHEIGHNLGMYHSGEEEKSYQDKTCLMGMPNTGDDAPLQCFNGAKSWFLTWYEDRHVTVTERSWRGAMVGIDDYLNGQTDKGRHFVIARIVSTAIKELELYVMYNRKEGVNKGVVEYGDKVTVVKAFNDEKRSKQSWLEAALGQGESYRKQNFNGPGKDLVIKVCSMNEGRPDYSDVIITIDGDGLSCSEQQQTNAPTRAPTNAPTRVPTNAPTMAPTMVPTTVPSLKPTVTSSTKCPLAATREQNCLANSNCCAWDTQSNKCSNVLKCPSVNCDQRKSKSRCRRCCQWKKGKCLNRKKCRKGCTTSRKKKCNKDPSNCCEWSKKEDTCATASQCRSAATTI